MDNGMLDRLRQLAEKLEELNARMERPDFYADPKKAAAFLREQKELEPVVNAYRAYCRAKQDMSDALELMSLTLLDHIVVAEDDFVSMRDSGFLHEF